MRFITLMISLTCLSSFGEDFRSFTDKNGRSVSAKILKVNTETNKVTLQKKDTRTTTVPISIFSDNDQKYILSWSTRTSVVDKKDQLKKYSPILTKDKIASLLDTYVINEENLSSDSLSRLRNYSFQLKRVSARTKIDYGFEIELTVLTYHRDGSVGEMTDKGWILLTPDGEVKYDSFKNPHPVERLYRRLRILKGWVNLNYKDKDSYECLNTTINLLEELSVPSFKLTPHSSRSEVKDSMEEMAEWLLEHGTSFDISEPYVFFPEVAFEDHEATIKKYK